ncbi:MAG: hypothetical protein WBV40_09675 [Candidatus Cybelea sp.]
MSRDERVRIGRSFCWTHRARNHGLRERLTRGMQTTQELDRRPSPAARPHPLKFQGGLLWMASWETNGIYGIDPQSWEVRHEFESPGQPFGISGYGEGLLVVISHGDDDDRYLYKLSPERGFDLNSKTPCPDLTGSHLATQGATVYLGQMHYRRILVLKPDMTIERTIALPTRCGGLGFGPGGGFYIISADEEFEHLEFGTLDITKEAPPLQSIRPLPEEARSLAFDGARWWTCLRELNEIASFNA